MSALYALWIDHAQAFVMKADTTEILSTDVFESDVEPYHRGAATPEHYTITNPNKDHERRKNQMSHFFKAVAGALHDAEEVVVFGPGTAKNEWAHTVESDHPALHARVTHVETSDRLTENQMKAKARELLGLPRD